jgi:single-stranded-DNA-specific exonuclease
MDARRVPFDGIPGFMDPHIRELLPNPLVLKDMDKASARVADAVECGETIGIFGDYDVDGATSSAVLYRFLKASGANDVRMHIPDRVSEGYGLNIGGLEELKSAGCSLVVAVDCGITGFAEAEWARENGLDLVVADHHEAEANVPSAVAVVDPKRSDDRSSLGYLAACGVVFLLCVAVRAELRARGYYKEAAEEPDLMSLLDLVALGTVCDVVPLLGANRALVSSGLKVMARMENPGLKALCEISRAAGAPSVYSLGFILGPRINAGGRVGDSSIGVRLLTTGDAVEAQRLASMLDQFNSARKDIEAGVLDEAVRRAEAGLSADDNFIFVAGRGWHTGVIGIIAGRLRERFSMPALVATIDDDGVANGSGRSIPEIDLGTAIIRAKDAGILTEGGGHSMAAGFTLPEARIGEFRDFLKKYISEASGGVKIVPELRIDSVIDISGVGESLVRDLSVLEPFGSGNPEPRFAMLGAKLVGADAIGGGHIKCFFSGDNGRSVAAIVFRSVDTPMGEYLLGHAGERFKVAGKVKLNVYNGRRTVQFVVDDVAKA